MSYKRPGVKYDKIDQEIEELVNKQEYPLKIGLDPLDIVPFYILGFVMGVILGWLLWGWK